MERRNTTAGFGNNASRKLDINCPFASGCDRVNRAGFLKTAGLGMAAVGAAMTGFGGIGRAQIAPPPPPPVWYIGEDTITLGNWYEQVPGDKYGNCAWILGAMNSTPIRNENQVPVGEDYHFYDVYGGPLMQPGCGVDYKVYTCKTGAGCDVRALHAVSPDTTRRAACWFGNSVSIDLTGVAAVGDWELKLYVVDYDTTARAETITVTTSQGSASHAVSGFHDGKYVIFKLGAGAGWVNINVANTAGANAVVSGIFLNNNTAGNPSTAPYFVSEDTTTQGNWPLAGFFVLSAMNAPSTMANYPTDPSYDIQSFPYGISYSVTASGSWAWTDYCTLSTACNVLESSKQKNVSFAWSWGPDTTGKGLEVPNPWSYVVYPQPQPPQLGTAAWASCYDDGGETGTSTDLYVDLTLPAAGGCSNTSCYQVSFYATDYDSACRKQVIEIYDPLTGTLLARSHDPIADPNYGLVGPGVYHTFFMPAGSYLVRTHWYGCSNAILSGIFVDCVDCPKGNGDMRTIGY